MAKRLDRRELLKLIGIAPVGAALVAACGSNDVVKDAVQEVAGTEPEAKGDGPAPPRTEKDEERFVIDAGEWERRMMAGTHYETPLYVFGSGRPGKIVLVLGGVHGNEPGGWMGAERIVDEMRPRNGALLVIPRANRVAVGLFERTTDELADLNRSYPGFEDGKPMERMALEISNTIREFHVNLVHDMHESWAFYKDRPTNGTAFIGETVATNGEEGLAIARAALERVNAKIQHPREEFFLRDFGGQSSQLQMPNLPRQQDTPPPGRGTSSLGLNRTFPGLISLLVEMGQQQALERRTALHVSVLEEVLREIGVT